MSAAHTNYVLRSTGREYHGYADCALLIARACMSGASRADGWGKVCRAQGGVRRTAGAQGVVNTSHAYVEVSWGHLARERLWKSCGGLRGKLGGHRETAAFGVWGRCYPCFLQPVLRTCLLSLSSCVLMFLSIVIICALLANVRTMPRIQSGSMPRHCIAC